MRDPFRAGERLLSQRRACQRGRCKRDEHHRRSLCASTLSPDRGSGTRLEQPPAFDGAKPALERDPAPSFGAAHPAHQIANLPAGPPLAPAQEQRPADRTGAEVTAAHDASRDDRAHSAAVPTPVAPNRDHQKPWRGASVPRATQLPLADAVPDQAESTASRSRCCPAARTATGPDPLDRRNAFRPKLDVNIRMNNMGSAQGLAQHLQSTTRRYQAPRHLFCQAATWLVLRLRARL